MQVIGREQAAVGVQERDGRLVGTLVGVHAGLVGQLAALEEIAGRAGRDHVFPCGASAARARDDVVEGQLVGRVGATAVLALEAVPQEHIEAREGGVARGLHIGLERDDRRQAHLERRRVDDAVVFLDDVDAVHEDGLDGVLPGPERQREVRQRAEVGVQDQCREGTGGALRRDDHD